MKHRALSPYRMDAPDRHIGCLFVRSMEFDTKNVSSTTALWHVHGGPKTLAPAEIVIKVILNGVTVILIYHLITVSVRHCKMTSWY